MITKQIYTCEKTNKETYTVFLTNPQMNLHTFLDKAQAGRYCRPVFFYSLLISLYGVFSS